MTSAIPVYASATAGRACRRPLNEFQFPGFITQPGAGGRGDLWLHQNLSEFLRVPVNWLSALHSGSLLYYMHLFQDPGISQHSLWTPLPDSWWSAPADQWWFLASIRLHQGNSRTSDGRRTGYFWTSPPLAVAYSATALCWSRETKAVLGVTDALPVCLASEPSFPLSHKSIPRVSETNPSSSDLSVLNSPI